MSDFHLISLCNIIYKVVSKVVANGLKDCIQKFVSPYQIGFVPWRNIHENIIIIKEVMHNMKGRKAYFVFKIDLSKTYDKISWEFI